MTFTLTVIGREKSKFPITSVFGHIILALMAQCDRINRSLIWIAHKL